MEIEVTGTNKKLLQQHAFLTYKANRAADKNKWKTFQKYNELAQKKLRLIARNLGIDSRKYLIAPKYTHNAVILSNREEVQS